MSINRKMKRKAQKINPDEYIKSGVIESAAIACEVVYENYGKLKNKERRLTVFMNLFIEALLEFENPTPLRLQVREQLARMVK